MRLHIVQIIVGLFAAVAFVLAFMAAGAVVASGLFLLAGMLLLAWLSYSLIRRVLMKGRDIRARS